MQRAMSGLDHGFAGDCRRMHVILPLQTVCFVGSYSGLLILPVRSVTSVCEDDM